MSDQQKPKNTVIDEVVESLIETTGLLKKELLENKEALIAKEQQTQALLTSLEDKFSKISIEIPKPDISMVKIELHKGLAEIREAFEKWPRPFKNEYRFSLFPEQLRSVEYVRAVLTRVILGFIGLIFLIFAYLLLDKHIR